LSALTLLGDRQGIRPEKTERWCVDGDILTGALSLHVFPFQLLPPSPSSAATKSMMVTFWYWKFAVMCFCK